MPQKQGGLESSMPVIGGLISTYYGGGYGTGAAIGGGLTDMYKGGSAQGTGALTSGEVATAKNSSVSGGLQAGGMQVAQGAMGASGSSGSNGGAQTGTDNSFKMPDMGTSGWQEGIPANGSTYSAPANDQSAAIDRRAAALDGGDHLTTLQNAKMSLGYMPDDMRKMYEPAIDQALYKAQQRPAGSTAPTSNYIQNKRYGG
jgi:hypothetical protein